MHSFMNTGLFDDLGYFSQHYFILNQGTLAYVQKQLKHNFEANHIIPF